MQQTLLAHLAYGTVTLYFLLSCFLFNTIQILQTRTLQGIKDGKLSVILKGTNTAGSKLSKPVNVTLFCESEVLLHPHHFKPLHDVALEVFNKNVMPWVPLVVVSFARGKMDAKRKALLVLLLIQ